MKKIIRFLTVLLVVFTTAFIFTACGGGNEDNGGNGGGGHVHDYTFKTETVVATCANQGYTKHICSCGDFTSDNFVPSTLHVLDGDMNCTTCDKKASEGLRIVGEEVRALYNCKDAEVIIPKDITSINSSAFKDKTQVTAVYIPKTVIEIKNDAFSGCVNLTTVIFQEGSELSVLGDNAFKGCVNLKNIDFGQCCSLTSVGTRAFFECSALSFTEINGGLYLGSESSPLVFMGIKDEALTSLNVVEGTKVIYENSASRNTSITEVTLPNSIKQICGEAFFECFNINSVTYLGTYNEWATINFVDSYSPHYYARELIAEGIVNGTLTLTVETINEYAFNNCLNIESLVLADSVKEIGKNAFVGCSKIRDLKIGNGIETIGVKAFENCTKLFEICNDSSFNLTLGSIDNGYVSTYAKNIYTSKSGSSKYIVQNGFYIFPDNGNKVLIDYTAKNSVVSIPSGVQIIEGYALYGKDYITELIIPEGVKEIGDYAFAGLSGITEINIPNSVEKIGNHSFEGCSKAEVINFGTQRKLKTIGDYGFASCRSLTEAILPDGLIRTGDYSFNDCANLLLFSMPASLEELAWRMVNGCFKCDRLYFRGVDGVNENGVSFNAMANQPGKLWWNWYFECATAYVYFPKSNGFEEGYIYFESHGRG